MQVQRLGRAADVRAGERGPGAPLAGRGRLRRAAHPRAGVAVAVAAGAVGGDRADRRDLPHREPALAGDAGGVPAAAARAWRRSPPGSPSPRTPAAPWSSTSAATPSSSRTGSTSTGSPPPPPRPALAGHAGAADGRVRRPDRRAAQGPAGAGRRRPGGAGRATPGPRFLVLGRGDGGGGAGRARRRQRRRRGAARRRSDDDDKAALLRSVDVYVAPHTGGESFGIVLVEAMSAGAPVVASDLGAFRRVLDDGELGVLFPVGRRRRALAAALLGAARRPRPSGCRLAARRVRRRAPVRLEPGRRARCSPSTRRSGWAPTGSARTPRRRRPADALARADGGVSDADRSGGRRSCSPCSSCCGWYLSLLGGPAGPAAPPGRVAAGGAGRPARPPGGRRRRGGAAARPATGLLVADAAARGAGRGGDARRAGAGSRRAAAVGGGRERPDAGRCTWPSATPADVAALREDAARGRVARRCSAQACTRVQLARRFHNDAVAAGAAGAAQAGGALGPARGHARCRRWSRSTTPCPRAWSPTPRPTRRVVG